MVPQDTLTQANRELLVSDSDIRWSQELRKIEREYDGLQPAPAQPKARAKARVKPRAPSRTQIRLQKVQEIIARGRLEEQLAAVGVWARLALVGALATSLFWWPYQHDCGFPLAAYLSAHVMVLVGGMTLAMQAWRERAVWPFAGVTTFMLVAWTVLALNALPRFGYSPAAVQRASWACRVTP